MHIAFRTDSSSKLGIGHLVRCLVLADEFSRRGHHCTFVCRDIPGHQAIMATRHGHRLILLPSINDPADASGIKACSDRDREETRCALDMQKPDWLVCDHYGIDAGWEVALRGTTDRILAIDDLADRCHDCDALIDQNLFPDIHERYSNLVVPGTVLLLGPEFALLRREFIVRREALERRFEQPLRLFVGFGGADPENATEMVVAALLEAFGESLEMTVVAGPANPHFKRLVELCENKQSIRLYRTIECMADCLAQSDLAIGGGGVSALERCVLGLPSLIYAIADNQVIPSETLAGMGAAVYMGKIENQNREDLITCVTRMVINVQARIALARSGMRLVDGAGASRAVATLLKFE